MGQLKKNKRYLKGVPLSMSELLSSFEKKKHFSRFVCLFVCLRTTCAIKKTGEKKRVINTQCNFGKA